MIFPYIAILFKRVSITYVAAYACVKLSKTSRSIKNAAPLALLLSPHNNLGSSGGLANEHLRGHILQQASSK